MFEFVENVQQLFPAIPLTGEMIALMALGIGVFAVVFGLAGATAGPSAEIRRMRARGGHQIHGADFDLLRSGEEFANSLLKAFVPSTKREKTKIAMRIRQAGWNGRHALRNYYLARAILALCLPALFLLVTAIPQDVQVMLGLHGILSKIGLFSGIQIVTVLTLIGYFAPAVYLAHRIRERRDRIWKSLPNALDLTQIAIEAGLGFDAAMVRVGNELATAAPDIAQEFLMLQLEIQAGKDREAAFLDMAARTGVDEVASFANTILQAARFGTSVSTALAAYSKELRIDRELKAQEKANKLPVKMSGVIALCMMPALLLICLTPMIIRWVNIFGS